LGGTSTTLFNEERQNLKILGNVNHPKYDGTQKERGLEPILTKLFEKNKFIF